MLITFRVSEAEKTMIQDDAIKDNKSVSEYCRSTLLNHVSKKLTNDAIINRLNQIDRLVEFVNSKSSTDEKNGETLNLLIETILILRASIKPETRQMLAREMERLGITPWKSST